jgi:hypothetical protein
VTTNSQGVATVALPHGSYTVTNITAVPTGDPGASDPPRHEAALAPSSITIAAADINTPTTKDLEIQEARIAGTAASVHSTGGAPTGIRVRLFTGSSTTGTEREERLVVPSTPAGTYEFFVPASSSFTVVADVEGDTDFIADEQAAPTGAIASGVGPTTTRNLTVYESAAVVIQVIGDTDGDGDTEGIDSASVTLQGVTGALTTNANGIVTFPTVRALASTLKLSVSKTGYDTNTSATVAVAPGQDVTPDDGTDPGDDPDTDPQPNAVVTLVGRGTATITVVTVNTTNGINNVNVSLTRNGTTVGPTQTNNQGVVSFTNLESGRYTITAAKANFTTSNTLTVDVPAGGTGTQTVPLTPS